MQEFSVDGHATRAVKQNFLASQHLVTGESSLNFYSQAKESTPEIIDLVVSNLPKNFDEQSLRKVSGSKHIVSAVVDVDVFTGSCKGTGRIQIRLNHGETADSVRLNYLRLGYKVEDFINDPRKKPTLT